MPNKTLTVYLANNNGKDCYVWRLPQGQVWAVETDDRADAMLKLATDFAEFFKHLDIDEEIGETVRDRYRLLTPWEIRRVKCSVFDLIYRPLRLITKIKLFLAVKVAGGRDLIEDNTGF